MISNLNFNDISNDFWAREAITRAGAFNMIKGYDDGFHPSDTISNEEAIAFVIRIMGLEDEAQQRGVELKASSQSQSILPVWSLGYLSIALDSGLITEENFASAIVEDQETLLPEEFHRYNKATREQTADWIVKGINYILPDTFIQEGTQQRIYNFSDWKNISPDFATSVELCTSKGIMQGLKDGTFNPKGPVSRAEMAQILRSLDSVYFTAMGYERKNGTVGGIKDFTESTTGVDSNWRNIYIRNDSGFIDVLKYETEASASPQAKNKDAVVYKGGNIGGLVTLTEGDKIEYIVNPLNDELLYVNMTGDVTRTDLEGTLDEIDYQEGKIYITDSTGKQFIYPLMDGIYGNDTTSVVLNSLGVIDKSKNYIYMNKDKLYSSNESKIYDGDLPYGSKIKIYLINNIVDQIVYIGEPKIIDETRGIVIENNDGLGYLTIIDNNGNEITKNYYSDDIIVEKQQYYDMTDEIGYLDQVFPNFQYDARDTVISEIEPGDIVFIRTYEDDPDTIESISASTNYIMKYGKIRQMTNDGQLAQLLIEYEDKQTAWFDVANSIFVMKNGKSIDMGNVQVGDWAKLLVNQAIIAPGYVMESVKEVNIEAAGHEINKIIKGKLGSVNQIQSQISVEYAQELGRNGWTDYEEIKTFSIANNDIDYYYEGKRISIDYVMRYLKRSDGQVYIALENNYAGDKVSMVSFRTGRDEVLNPDTIITADGVGTFSTTDNTSPIYTDSGTIVRRYGRLVTGNDIMIPDYATVVLNGNSKAAVVDIYDEPDTSRLSIIRGRIASVDEGKSFKVQSMSILNDMKWIYTPVQREFIIDNDTVFINTDGVVDKDTFMDYTEDTVVNKVYNIIADGTRATHVIEAPYSAKAVKGVVYDKDAEEGTVSIKDSMFYTNDTGVWADVSNVNNGMTINTAGNCIVIKNNRADGTSILEAGDQIRVMTNSIPDSIGGSMTINGYIIIVEK